MIDYGTGRGRRRGGGRWSRDSTDRFSNSSRTSTGENPPARASWEPCALNGVAFAGGRNLVPPPKPTNGASSRAAHRPIRLLDLVRPCRTPLLSALVRATEKRGPREEEERTPPPTPPPSHHPRLRPPPTTSPSASASVRNNRQCQRHHYHRRPNHQ